MFNFKFKTDVLKLVDKLKCVHEIKVIVYYYLVFMYIE